MPEVIGFPQSRACPSQYTPRMNSRQPSTCRTKPSTASIGACPASTAPLPRQRSLPVVDELDVHRRRNVRVITETARSRPHRVLVSAERRQAVRATKACNARNASLRRHRPRKVVSSVPGCPAKVRLDVGHGLPRDRTRARTRSARPADSSVLLSNPTHPRFSASKFQRPCRGAPRLPSDCRGGIHGVVEELEAKPACTHPPNRANPATANRESACPRGPRNSTSAPRAKASSACSTRQSPGSDDHDGLRTGISSRHPTAQPPMIRKGGCRSCDSRA